MSEPRLSSDSGAGKELIYYIILPLFQLAIALNSLTVNSRVCCQSWLSSDSGGGEELVYYIILSRGFSKECDRIKYANSFYRDKSKRISSVFQVYYLRLYNIAARFFNFFCAPRSGSPWDRTIYANGTVTRKLVTVIGCRSWSRIDLLYNLAARFFNFN